MKFDETNQSADPTVQAMSTSGRPVATITVLVITALILTLLRDKHGPPILIGACLAFVMMK
jgi:hypothetical protein